MIAMGGLGENKWDGLGQCLHTPTILQGDEQLNANCFHHHYHHWYCHDIIISVLSQLHYHSHRTRRKGGRGVAPMRHELQIFRTLLRLLFGIVAIIATIIIALPFLRDMKKGWDRGG